MERGLLLQLTGGLCELIYTELHCTALHCTVLYSTVRHLHALHSTSLHCTAALNHTPYTLKTKILIPEKSQYL